MRSFVYFLREAFSGFKKNFSTVIGAIVTIFLSLLVIGIFMIVTLVINQMVSSVESQVSITIFLSDTASDDDVTAFRNEVAAIAGVSGVDYVSKDQALERLKETADPAYIAQLDGNPLPASFEITLSNPEDVQSIADQVTALDLFPKVIDSPDNPTSSVRYGQDIVNKLFSISNAIRFTCLGLVLLLLFVALIFINNTIRLAIFARRKEIAIMRLVGASNGFIRGPFLMEGILQALIGSALAIITIVFTVNALSSGLQANIPWLGLSFAAMPLKWVYLILLVAGLVIGLFGSAWALRRYLKV
ncbi:MAG: permease-like cell division protein FtsX [Coriobacteriia bacterium]|nr:permease-like cell division protein FtsX [Coriobacteriia bacterium]